MTTQTTQPSEEHTVYGHHQCHPSDSAGSKPHVLRAGQRTQCQCGKVWAVTRNDIKAQRGGIICGCGWERIDTDD
jgi:hypothetical protein